MEKYLYLTKPDWVHAWVHGGEVPLNLAGTYLRQQRGGIYTPDENRLLDANADIALLPPGLEIGGAKAFWSTRNTYNGAQLPDIQAVNGYQEALIHCMSNDVDADVAGRLGKSACVRILSVERLKAVLDEQVGVASRADRCIYTDEERQIDHFVKPLHDRWQNEYRLAWPGIDQPKLVTLPPGLAEPVALDIRQWVEVDGRRWRNHFEGRRFDGERVELDGNLFSECTFSASCLLVFAATDPARFSRCRFDSPRWKHVGSAAHMQNHMAMLYHSLSADLARNWFHNCIGDGHPAAAKTPRQTDPHAPPPPPNG